MLRVLSLVALLVLPSVCFAQPAVVVVPSVPDLSGKWSGYWVSDKNGHNGPLRATFRQQDWDTYRVTYSGRFAKIIPFRYSTTMDVVGTTLQNYTFFSSVTRPVLTHSTTKMLPSLSKAASCG